MIWRRVIYEFEADLYEIPMPRVRRREKGELERKRYSNGEERLKVSLREVKVPDGERVAVVIGDDVICELAVQRQRARHELSSERGHSVPEVTAGDVVEVLYAGRPLLRGTFRPD